MATQPLSWKQRLSGLDALAVGVWGIFIAITTVKFIAKPAMHTVYAGYAMCSRAWWNGVLFEMDPDTFMYARQYSPAFTEIIAPFASLPDSIGGPLWFLLSISVLLTGFYRFLSHDAATSCERAIAFLILPWIGMASIYNGQANILMTGCMLWATCLLAERKWWLGALALALPVTMKTYPIALGMIFLLYYWRELLPRFLFVLVGIYAAPLLLHPMADVLTRYEDWLAFLVSGEQYARFEQVDIRSLLEKWGLRIAHADYIWVQATAGLAVVLCHGFWRGQEPRNWTLCRDAFILGTFWMVCFGPATEEATYLLAGPAISLVLAKVISSNNCLLTPQTALVPLRTLQTLFVLAALFAGPLQTSIFGDDLRRAVHAHRLAPLGMLIFVLLYVWQQSRTLQIRRQRRDTASVVSSPTG